MFMSATEKHILANGIQSILLNMSDSCDCGSKSIGDRTPCTNTVSHERAKLLAEDLLYHSDGIHPYLKVAVTTIICLFPSEYASDSHDFDKRIESIVKMLHDQFAIRSSATN